MILIHGNCFVKKNTNVFKNVNLSVFIIAVNTSSKLKKQKRLPFLFGNLFFI